jgi:hypothetical protein
MPVKLSSLDGSNPQEFKTGQLEIVPQLVCEEGIYKILTICCWNDRGVRSQVLADPTGVKVTVVP